MPQGRHWLEPPEWWKKFKPLRWAAIGGILFVIASATWTAKNIIQPSAHPETDAFRAVAADPVPLMGELRSYDTVESVAARFHSAQMPADKRSVHPAPSPKYPPRDRDTITVAKYRHLGVEGELTVEFFNDRLYEVTFVPKDPETYADRLHAADPRLKRDRTNRVEFVEGPLRIASNVDFAATEVGRNLQTKPFVIWQDTRLVDALDDWDRRFVVSAPSR